MMKQTISLCILSLSLCSTAQLDCIEADAMHTYFWANYNHFRGNKAQASLWYQRVFEGNPSVHSYRGYLYHLDEAREYQKIVDLYPQIKDSVASDAKAQLIYALALEQVGRRNASDEELVKLQNKFKGDKEITFYTANKYLRTKEPENALAVVDDFLKITPRRPQNFIFYFMKSQIYAQLNKYAEAMENIKLALQLHPQFDKGWLLLALLEEQAGKIQEAINGYTSYLEMTTEPNKNIEQHVLQLALKQELAQRNTRMVILDPACFEKAAALFERKQFRQALSTVNECLKATPEHVELRLLKLRTLMAMEQADEALNTLAQWIEQKPNDEMWYKTLHLLVRSQGQTTPQAIYVLKKIESVRPELIEGPPLLALYIADLSLRSNNHDQAQTYLTKALKQTKETPLKVKILFQLALSYLHTNDTKLMGEVLETAHALDPNFVPVENLLAHHVAIADGDLERAQRLISSALSKHPQNVHLLDTQAMIYAKQKKDDKAQEIKQILSAHGAKCVNCEELKMSQNDNIQPFAPKS